MAKKEKVEAMVEGGRASAAPPLGPALGPLGVNIGEVINKINEKTAAYKGMKVPVAVIVDTSSKEFGIEVGSPPTSALIKKELGIDKGAGIPHKDKVGNLAIEQAIKIAKMKIDSMMARDLKSAVKTVVGSCNSLGVLVEGKIAVDINKDIDAGKYDKEIKAEATEVPAEKKEVLKEQLEEVRKLYEKDLAKIKAEKEAAKETAAPAEGAAPAAGKPAAPSASPGKAEKAPAKAAAAGKKK